MTAKKKKPLPEPKPPSELDYLVQGEHGNPSQVLGMQALDGEKMGIRIRAFLPYAVSVLLEELGSDRTWEMPKVWDEGVFELTIPGEESFPYQFRIEGDDGQRRTVEDPYRFPPQIQDFDLYLIGEGTHYRTYEHMGAHARIREGVKGVQFAVWAPNAHRVSVIGDFNRWNGLCHPMERRGDSGLWELFIPGFRPGDIYKYEIKGENGFLGEKADPYGFAAEMRPRTASVVWDVHDYEWKDEEWMAKRRRSDYLKEPVSVYEVHLGSWKRVPDEDDRFMTYREMVTDLIPYVKGMGYTHIELLPICEHPFDGSWGYQTLGYFAPTSRFGTPDDFKYFIDQCHAEGLGVLLDWVPAHFPKDKHGLAQFDGTHLYEHADPRKGEHMDWGTLIFNYGRNEVKTFLLSNAMFWADVYHIDGLRVDAVASMLYLDYSREPGEWLPNEFGGRENLEAVDFLKTFNQIVHQEYPGFMTFAEESTAWPMVSRPTYLGGLGFGFKWNMGWMNDILEYFAKEPIHRKFHHNDITFSLLYAFTENFILPFSHDEVVHGKGSMLNKMPGDMWQKFANLRLLYAFMYAHPGKKLQFMGCEFGQWDEWSEARSLDWHLCEHEPHQKLQQFMGDLNRLYSSTPALYEEDFTWDGFEWIDFHDADQSIISFARKGPASGSLLICVINFTPVPREGYRIGVPKPGFYREALNSDSGHYGGSNLGNNGGIPSDPLPWQGQDHSILATVPPLAAVLFVQE